MKQKRILSMVMAAAMMVSPLAVSAAPEIGQESDDKNGNNLTGNVTGVGGVDTKETNTYFKVVLPVDQTKPYDYLVDPNENGTINTTFLKGTPEGTKTVIFQNTDYEFGGKTLPDQNKAYSGHSNALAVANIGSSDVTVEADAASWTMNKEAILNIWMEAGKTEFSNLTTANFTRSSTAVGFEVTNKDDVHNATIALPRMKGYYEDDPHDPKSASALTDTTWKRVDEGTYYGTEPTDTDWKTTDPWVAIFRVAATAKGQGWTTGQASRIQVEWKITPDFVTMPSVLDKSGIIAWADGTDKPLEVAYTLGGGSMKASRIMSVRWVYGRDNEQVEVYSDPATKFVDVDGKNIIIPPKTLLNLKTAASQEGVQSFYYLPALFIVTFELEGSNGTQTVEDSFWVGIKD